MNRRTFFKATIMTVGSVYAFSALAEERRRGGGDSKAAASAPTLVDPKDGAAKGVNYVANIKDIKDTKLQTERSGVKFANQHCSGCAFYQKDKETTVAGKKVAPCQMPFAAGKVVAAEGWCTSWAKKS